MVDIDDFFPLNDELGYLGVIVLSFVSSIIIFIPVPYIPVLIAATLNSKLDPNIIAISSAAGISAGRSAIFLISYFGRKILKDKTKRRMLPVQRLLSRYS